VSAVCNLGELMLLSFLLFYFAKRSRPASVLALLTTIKRFVSYLTVEAYGVFRVE
jgi:hypothetical protein